MTLPIPPDPPADAPADPTSAVLTMVTCSELFHTDKRSVVIGDRVLTANNVYISDNVHSYEDISRPIIEQPVKLKREVSIGDVANVATSFPGFDTLALKAGFGLESA